MYTVAVPLVTFNTLTVMFPELAPTFTTPLINAVVSLDVFAMATPEFPGAITLAVKLELMLVQYPPAPDPLCAIENFMPLESAPFMYRTHVTSYLVFVPVA